MKSIQFVQVTPEQLQDALIKGVQDQLDQLKIHFQPREPEQYLTRAEVSEMLKVDLSTIHNWSKAGKIIRHCLGNRVYFKRSEIEASLIQIN